MKEKAGKKKRVFLWLAVCGIMGSQMLLTNQAYGAEADVTWKKVTQTINEQNQCVYDGNKTDFTMPSHILEKTAAGVWGYIDQGTVRQTDSIVTPNSTGWWHVVNGWVDTSSGVQYTTDGKIKFENGKRDFTANETTDLWQKRQCYLVDGKMDETYTGLAAGENGIFWFSGGEVKDTYSNVVEDTLGIIPGGGMLYIYKGAFASTADTIANSEDSWWKIRNGLVDFSYNGLANNKNGWYYVKNGQVDFTYNGTAQNENGIWYVSKGKVDNSFNGQAYGYYFTGGKAQ